MSIAIRENMKVFSTVFLITLLVGIFVRQLLLPYLLPAMHAGSGFMTGDSIGYHEFAAKIAERIRLEGWGAWQLRPESEIFTLAAPSGIASAIYAAFGTNPLFLLPFNAAVHAASAVLLFRMMQSLFQDKRVSLIATLPFIFFPTAISWHSQLLKDGIFILGVYAYLAAWIMMAKLKVFSARRLLVMLLLASIGLTIIWTVRSYMLAVLTSTSVALGIFLICWSIKARRTLNGYMVTITGLGLFVVTLLTIVVLINKIDARPTISEWTGQEVKNNVYSGRPLGSGVSSGATSVAEDSPHACRAWIDSYHVPIVLSRIASKIVIVRGGFYDEIYMSSGSTIDREVCITSFFELVAYIPRAMQLGLLAPFPDQWIKAGSHGGGASRLMVGLEMSLSYVALLALVCCGRRFVNRPEFWMLLGFAVSMIVLYALVTPNLGALHRMRYGFLTLLVGMGIGVGLTRFRFAKTLA